MTLRFGILTASDRSARGERPDASGPALSRLLQEQGWSVNRQALLPDDQSAIRDLLASWADGGELDVILTTGGTGFSPRDVTPEATRLVIEREAPCLAVPKAQWKTCKSSSPFCLTPSSSYRKTPAQNRLTDPTVLVSIHQRNASR